MRAPSYVDGISSLLLPALGTAHTYTHFRFFPFHLTWQYSPTPPFIKYETTT